MNLFLKSLLLFTIFKLGLLQINKWRRLGWVAWLEKIYSVSFFLSPCCQIRSEACEWGAELARKSNIIFWRLLLLLIYWRKKTIGACVLCTNQPNYATQINLGGGGVETERTRNKLDLNSLRHLSSFSSEIFLEPNKKFF